MSSCMESVVPLMPLKLTHLCQNLKWVLENHQAISGYELLAIFLISQLTFSIAKELFRCPFPIYVDASRRLYQLMGMTKLSNDFGPMKNRAAYHQHAIPRQVVGAIGVSFASACGGAIFLTHKSAFPSLERSLQNASRKSRHADAIGR